MINFLDFLNLSLKLNELSDNITDNEITKVIHDDQFKLYNYDYDILYVIYTVLTFKQPIEINNAEQVENIKIKVDNIISQLVKLSKFNYSENDILIFKTFMFYRVISENGELRYSNSELYTSYLNEIFEILKIKIDNTNSSGWGALELLRRAILLSYARNIRLEIDSQIILNQLEIAKQNENQLTIIRKRLENILYDAN